MAEDQADGPVEEFALPPGMSPLDLVNAQAAAARADVSRPDAAGGHRSPPPRRSWSTASKTLVGLGAAVALAGILTGVALAVTGDSDDKQFYASAPVPAEADRLPASASAADRKVVAWVSLFYPKMNALTDEMTAVYAGQLTPTRAMAFCAKWVDNVEDLKTLPPAPDAVFESEFRGWLSAVTVFLDVCQRGDGTATRIAEQELNLRYDAMMERIDQLDG